MVQKTVPVHIKISIVQTFTERTLFFPAKAVLQQVKDMFYLKAKSSMSDYDVIWSIGRIH